jgi:hypothetical protein
MLKLFICTTFKRTHPAISLAPSLIPLSFSIFPVSYSFPYKERVGRQRNIRAL